VNIGATKTENELDEFPQITAAGEGGPRQGKREDAGQRSMEQVPKKKKGTNIYYVERWKNKGFLCRIAVSSECMGIRPLYSRRRNACGDW
jgi:hypothetical protein